MGSAADLKHLYNSKRWKQLRLHVLSKNPFCQCPHHKSNQYPANVVDHKIPHRGSIKLFWDLNNLQSMAKVCHDSRKQSEEKGGAGFKRGCDENGNPLTQDHEWWDKRGSDICAKNGEIWPIAEGVGGDCSVFIQKK